MENKYNEEENNYTKRFPVLSKGASVLATTGSWGVPLVSQAVSGLLRRFISDQPQQTQSSHSISANGFENFENFDSDCSFRKKSISSFLSTSLCPINLYLGPQYERDSTILLTKSLAEEIRLLVPPRLQLCDEWNMVYSLEKDGASLGTFYKKCSELAAQQNSFVLVVKDGRGDLFGAYLNEAPRIEPSFFGNGECFLWRATFISSPQMSLPLLPSADTTNMHRTTTVTSQNLLSPVSSNFNIMDRSKSNTSSISDRLRFKAFPYSGVNDYLILCEADYLGIGGGDGHYGLWLDDTFDRGISSHCPTFGNEPLSEQGEKFDVMGVEIWSLGTI